MSNKPKQILTLRHRNKSVLLYGCLALMAGPSSQLLSAAGIREPIDLGVLDPLPVRRIPIDKPVITPAEPQVASPSDLAIPGSVTVTIEPPEAVAEGARWMLDNGSEQPSGFQQQGVTPGRHTVRFANLASWREAGPLELLVIGGRPAQLTATFAPLPQFDFQGVPEQHARHGETVEFFVNAGNGGGELQLAAQPSPAGALTFDAATGHFTYAPAPADRLPFTLTFTAAGGESATTTITPLPVLPAEVSEISYQRALPDEESRDYITISEAQNAVETFNDSERETLSVTISGKTLVFASDHPAHLHQQYNQRANIKEFRLYADRVIIRSPLLLPQTHVTIHAREFRFESNGSIDTTPKAREKVPTGAVFEDNLTQGIEGDPGHNGGDVDVLVERFHADSSDAKRFVLRGGHGGPAGEGRDGKSELAMGFPSADWDKLMGRCGNIICGTLNGKIIIYTQDKFPNLPTETCGSKVSARGENAVPSGRPGRAGNGGILRSTVDVTGVADLSGGSAGAKGGNHAGSALSRVYGYQFTSTIHKSTGDIVSSSFQAAPKVRGLDAAAPAALSPIGVSGRVELIPDPAAWLHSFALRSVIQFAKDAYLNGHESDARALMAEYGEIVHTLQPEDTAEVEEDEDVFAEHTNLNQALLEMATIVHRIDSNLDFFGNPAGWVPMLSFEANLVAFENEVNQSIPILYLGYWLTQAATSVADTLGASEAAHEKLEDELDKMVVDFNQAQTAIPTLKVEAETIQLRIGAMQGRLLDLERQLKERAEQNVEDRHKLPFWKKALGTLSVVAQLVPVGQPVVGKVGSGLGLIAQIDPDKPLESAAAIGPKAFEVFSQKSISVCFSGSTTNSTNAATAKAEKLKRLSECGKFLGEELKQLGAVFKEAQIDKKEVETELEKLKASDPVFNQITQELAELNLEKERFDQELAAALQLVSGLTSEMTENVAGTHELERRIGQGLTTLDHNALLHIEELERRAKDRLLKFQYFVAKAFQYRTLQPYSGNLQLNRLFERFKALVEGGASHVLNEDDFANLKALYIAELRDIVSQAFEFVNSNAPERSVPISFRLNDEERRQLNEDGQLVINLQERGLFPTSQENIRIADLRTRKLTVHLNGGPIGAHGLMFLDFEHLGESRLTSGAQTFLFRHYQTEAANPISWGTVYDGVADQFSNSELSPAAQSLIRALLNQPTSNDNLLLFSRPAAAADILLTKQVLSDNGVDLVVDDLQVEVVYEFYRTSASRPELEVVVTDDLDPLIAVSRQDLNGRQDGRGDFRRVYPVTAPVTLEAPAQFGELQFERWIVNGQPQPLGQTVAAVNLTVNTRAEARFSPESNSDDSSPTNSPQAAIAPSGFKGNDSESVAGGSEMLGAEKPELVPLPAAAGSISFGFLSIASVRYVVEVTSILEDPNWTGIATLIGTGQPMRYTTSLSAPNGFFRLRAIEAGTAASAQ